MKGSWGMGGGLLGVDSFSLSWDSVSIPVAMFSDARCLPLFGRSFEALSGAAWSLLGSCLGLFLLSLGAAADLYGFSCFVRDGSCVQRRHARAGRVRERAPGQPAASQHLLPKLQQSVA